MFWQVSVVADIERGQALAMEWIEDSDWDI